MSFSRSSGSSFKLDEMGWWNDDFLPLREKVNSGELYRNTVHGVVRLENEKV